MTLKKVLAAALMVPALMGAGCDSSHSPSKNRPESAPEVRHSRLNNTAISYLSQPRFTNSDFLEQITGTKSELQMYNLSEDLLYFSLPAEHSLEEALKRLSFKPKRAEFGRVDGPDLILGDYVFSKPGHYFFRFPAEDFRINNNAQISISFEDVQYTVTLDELHDFITNRSIYGGLLSVKIGSLGLEPIKMVNHGAFIAKKGEPSLERLVARLVGASTRKEDAAQALLNFVSNQIRYDWSDALASVEVLKRPNEVLMARGSDCSGKVILYASLLEQTGVDYLLAYFDGHIAAAVEGDFMNSNGLSFTSGNKSYALAETTTESFRIGTTRLPDLRIEEMRYTQRPGEHSLIYGAKSGKPLPFVR